MAACKYKPGDPVHLPDDEGPSWMTANGEVVQTSQSADGDWRVIVRDENGRLFSIPEWAVAPRSTENVIDAYDAVIADARRSA